MAAGIAVFARLDSRRLPGKALLDLAGRPMLGRVLDRLRRVPGAPPLAVATSDRALDDPIAAFAAGEGLACVRGDAQDVLGRALAAARQLGFDPLVRISGDSPFIDPGLVAEVIALQAATGAEIATNVFPRSFPPGQSVEALSLAALGRLAADALAAEDREHVTAYAYRHPEQFRIVNLAADLARASPLAMTVDTPADLDRARRWLALAGSRAETLGLKDLLALGLE